MQPARRGGGAKSGAAQQRTISSFFAPAGGSRQPPVAAPREASQPVHDSLDTSASVPTPAPPASPVQPARPAKRDTSKGLLQRFRMPSGTVAAPAGGMASAGDHGALPSSRPDEPKAPAAESDGMSSRERIRQKLAGFVAAGRTLKRARSLSPPPSQLPERAASRNDDRGDDGGDSDDDGGDNDGDGGDGDDGQMSGSRRPITDRTPPTTPRKFGRAGSQPAARSVSARTDASTPPPKKPRKGEKLTPLEQQFLEIKSAHPDVLLFVEVGYKYRFFGEDAKIASRELGIVAFMDHSMMTASIPVHRLEVHVKKLVNLGHKAGVVRQTETAALKAAGSNKSAPFVRQLANVYTRGTMLFDMEAHSDDAVEASGVESEFLVVLHEYKVTESGDCRIAILAVQLSTATVVYDDFADNFMRTELETRLSHVEPAELLLPVTPLSTPTQKVIGLAHSKLSRVSESVRIERRHGFDRKPELARQDIMDTVSGSGKPRWIQDLPLAVFPSLVVLHEYLTDFGLSDLLSMDVQPKPFGQIGYMNLNANTLASLEIFRNQGNGSTSGSLFEAMNTTKTRQLQQRLDAVDELRALLADENAAILRARSILSQLPDLEKGLPRIYFQRASPLEVWRVISALKLVRSMFPNGVDQRIRSPLLRGLMEPLWETLEPVAELVARVSRDGAQANNKLLFFESTEMYPEIGQWVDTEREVLARLSDHLDEVRAVLKMPKLEYTTVSGVEFLVELTNTRASKAPPSWIKISTTKAVSRFHTPQVVKLIQERNCAVEELNAACERAFKSFMAEVSSHFQVFRQAIRSIAVLDCLFCLSRIADNPQYTRPTFAEQPMIAAKNSLNPILHRLHDGYVPNDVALDAATGPRCLLITGPNMGGKSCFVKQVALMCVMAQVGAYVPAQQATMGVFDSIHVRMGAADDLARNQSTFMKEMQDTSAILRRCTDRSLVILDELGRGTATFDGTAIAYATLRHLAEQVRCVTLFVTHYPSLGALADEVAGGAIRNVHMSFLRTGRSSSDAASEGADADASSSAAGDKDGDTLMASELDRAHGPSADRHDGDEEIVFLHKLADGVSKHSYGLNVARLANVPAEVISVAARKSRELEAATERRTAVAAADSRRKLFVELVRAAEAGNAADTLLGLFQRAARLVPPADAQAD
nr:Mismatch repair protein msh3 [Polyrhizophydium stewartii]